MNFGRFVSWDVSLRNLGNFCEGFKVRAVYEWFFNCTTTKKWAYLEATTLEIYTFIRRLFKLLLIILILLLIERSNTIKYLYQYFQLKIK